MPDIARLDGEGMLVAVETVADEEHGTDLAKRKIALPDGHDMRRHLKNYRWDVLRGHFIPKSMEPLAEAERETPKLVEGLVEAIEHIYETIGGKQRQARPMAAGGDDDAPVELPPIPKRAIEKFRRVVPRRKPVTITLDSEQAAARVAAAEASLANNPPALPASEAPANDKGKSA